MSNLQRGTISLFGLLGGRHYSATIGAAEGRLRNVNLIEKMVELVDWVIERSVCRCCRQQER